MPVKILYTTLPDEKTAREIAERVIKERLCACVNFYEIGSVYRWEGKIQNDREWGVWFKTSDDRISDLVSRVKELHPYSVPALLVIPVDAVNGEYEKWLEGEVK